MQVVLNLRWSLKGCLKLQPTCKRRLLRPGFKVPTVRSSPQLCDQLQAVGNMAKLCPLAVSQGHVAAFYESFAGNQHFFLVFVKTGPVAKHWSA